MEGRQQGASSWAEHVGWLHPPTTLNSEGRMGRGGGGPEAAFPAHSEEGGTQPGLREPGRSQECPSGDPHSLAPHPHSPPAPSPTDLAPPPKVPKLHQLSSGHLPSPPAPPSPQLCARWLSCTGLPGGCASLSSACDEANSSPGQGVTLVHQQHVCCRVTSACWLLGSLSTHVYFKDFYGSVENLVGGNDLLL